MDEIKERIIQVVLLFTVFVAICVWLDHEYNPRHAERWVQLCPLENR